MELGSDTLLQELIANSIPITPLSNALELISSAEFAEMNLTHEWLVPRILVRNEPAIIGGPKKVLKTGIVLDLAISLAAGITTDFLAHFQVPQPYRVGIISGESGPYSLRRRAAAICSARKLHLPDLPVFWGFQMPSLGCEAARQGIAEVVQKNKLDVLFFDPMYLGLLAGAENTNSADVLRMGPLLSAVAATCLPNDCTPVFVHHTRKLQNTDKHSPLDLDQLSMSGFAEFARQWLLISRRSAYIDGTGQHSLWLRIGGSAGHSGLYGLEINEGVSSDGLTGIDWRVEVLSAEMVDQRRKSAAADALDNREASNAKRVLDYLQSQQGATATMIRDQLKISGSTAKKATDYLLKQKSIFQSRRAWNGRVRDVFFVNQQIAVPTPGEDEDDLGDTAPLENLASSAQDIPDSDAAPTPDLVASGASHPATETLVSELEMTAGPPDDLADD